MRTGAQVLKAKKTRVIKYLEERAEEISRGLGYHRAGSVEQSRAEAKRVLVLLLKVMVENDGRLSGKWVASDFCSCRPSINVSC